jgi:sugar phosphate isomerase/epimerase
MPRKVALVTGQWADLPLDVVAEKASAWGYDGLELACWGDHFDVDRALESDAYVRDRRALLERHGLELSGLNDSLAGQCVCDDPIDERHRAILTPALWGDGSPEGVRRRSAEHLTRAAAAARSMGVDVVKTLTGSAIWSRFYFFPPTPPETVDAGFRDFGDRFRPICDAYQRAGVRLAHEPHPSSIAYDLLTSRRALEALGHHPAFGFNLDPSHFAHQFVDPARFVEELGARVFGVHVKDTRLQLDGRASILGSHLGFGDARRGWDFCSAGRGDVKWDRLFRALNAAGYDGWLGVEWEDPGMDREWGAREALAFVRKQDFAPASAAFDAAFTSGTGQRDDGG